MGVPEHISDQVGVALGIGHLLLTLPGERRLGLAAGREDGRGELWEAAWKQPRSGPTQPLFQGTVL